MQTRLQSDIHFFWFPCSLDKLIVQKIPISVDILKYTYHKKIWVNLQLVSGMNSFQQ